MADYGKVSLSIYSITINKEGDRTKNYVLSDFNNGTDLYAFFKDCMESWVYKKTKEDDQLMKDEINQKIIRLKRRDDDKPFVEYFGRSYSGLYESGDYGDERTIIDILTGEPDYVQRSTNAPMIPFYYLFHIGKDCSTGFLILQRFKQFGVFGLCKNIFTSEFKKKYPNYTLRIEQFSSAELVRKSLTNAEIKGVILKEVSHGNVSARTITQSINVNPVDYNLELVLKAKRGKQFPNKEDLLSGNKFICVDGLNYESTDFKIKIGDRTRNFTKQQVEEFGYSCDITDYVRWGTDKMPTYDSVNKEARDLLQDIFKELEKKKK